MKIDKERKGFLVILKKQKGYYMKERVYAEKIIQKNRIFSKNIGETEEKTTKTKVVCEKTYKTSRKMRNVTIKNY